MDAEVVQSFSLLNSLSKEEKSLDVPLPVYKVLNVTHNDQASSVWEFIEGMHLEGFSPDQAIAVSDISESAKKSLQQQLLRLESICGFLNISDLHVKNVIFSNLGSDSPQIIPIDLESIQPGATGLFMRVPELPLLKETEVKILKESRRAIEDLPVRFVPIHTSHFLGGLTRCDAFVPFASEIKTTIEQEGYTLCISQEELEWFVLNDFLHNDVPYLTKTASLISYEVAGEKKLIAKRQ